VGGRGQQQGGWVQQGQVLVLLLVEVQQALAAGQLYLLQGRLQILPQVLQQQLLVCLDYPQT
jgi:hypothetical protein